MADDSPPTPAIKDRIGEHKTPEEMIFTPLGGPYPEIMIQLSDGTTVSESVFGKPPPDLPEDQWETWYAERDFELISQANPEDLEQ